MQSAEEFARDHLYNVTFDRLSDDTRARDAEWQARADKLEAVLKECGRKLDEALAAEDWGEVKSVWCDIDAALGREA